MSITSSARWRPRIAWGGAVSAAILGGILAARPAITAVSERGMIRNGPWTTLAATGSTEANPYERAAVAVAGLYALAPHEALYFTAFTDDSGAALSGRCDYRVHGAAPAARWWSITLYGADHYLVANSAGVHSRHAGNLQGPAPGAGPTGAGSIVIDVSALPPAQASHWLPAPEDAPFSLTLRTYHPSPALAQHRASAALPSIERRACR